MLSNFSLYNISCIPPIIRFALAGFLAAIVNISMRSVFSQFLPFEFAVLLAFPFGLTTGYALSRFFVFERSGQTIQSEYVRFALVNVVGLAQVWLISVALARGLFPAVNFTWHAELLAHVIGVLSPVATSYYGHKVFTFKRSIDHR